MNIPKKILDDANKKKLTDIQNSYVERIIEKYALLCKPSKITVLTDSEEDIQYLRDIAIRNGEEIPLAILGHTVHFDGYYDQARDKPHTKILVDSDEKLGKLVNTGKRYECLKEIQIILDGIMKGKEMLVCFHCLGPLDSDFSILALQLTDSSYVAHIENILYRPGYEQFKKMKNGNDFFHFIHSEGELDFHKTTKNTDKRRIYVDIDESRVFSANDQYGGNSMGLKKLAFRLAIDKASKEGWLCEHMFLMGVHALESKRVTYLAGAFPSMCAKTSTAMIPGESIVGDDIAYIKPDRNGIVRGVNIECGVFGIIKDISADKDPVIFKSLTTPREIIFSNVLLADNKPYWTGMGSVIPKRGYNHSGEWFEGKKDESGNVISPSHKNSRFALRIDELDNADPKAEDKNGVAIGGIIYGGRDSDTSVPVYQSFSWNHGVFIGASIESETTAATLGQEGMLVHNPMAIADFLPVKIGKYISNHIEFGKKLRTPPKIFATNYFLKENGKYLNGIPDKKVWILWIEGRINGDFDVIETPIGLIPKYDDIKALFRKVFSKDYTLNDYQKQFSIRIDRWLKKMERIKKIYEDEKSVPQELTDEINEQIIRLKDEKDRLKKVKYNPKNS